MSTYPNVLISANPNVRMSTNRNVCMHECVALIIYNFAGTAACLATFYYVQLQMDLYCHSLLMVSQNLSADIYFLRMYHLTHGFPEFISLHMVSQNLSAYTSFLRIYHPCPSKLDMLSDTLG